MSLEIDVVGEVWLTCKEYINSKDRQAAADHVINVIADHNILERDIKAIGGTDSYLKRAVEEYLGEETEPELEDDDEDY